MKEFRRILGMNQEQLKRYVYKQLTKMYDVRDIHNDFDFVYAQGNIPVMLVAHLDTVHRVPALDIVFDRQQGIMWSPQGIGGDDRCGVYAILTILRKGFRPYVLFTTDEEMGGIGASGFTQKYPFLEEKLKYMIELDRRGKDDCVFYDCGNNEFIEYVKRFGFVEAVGTYSDISTLSPQYDVASVNLSIGYYNEHSTTEYINIGHMFATIQKVVKMLKDIKSCKYYDFQELQCSWWYSSSAVQQTNSYVQAQKQYYSSKKQNQKNVETIDDAFGTKSLEITEEEIF